MPIPEKYLVIKRSSLPRAGNGLFTTLAIKKGTRIVEYKGRIERWKDVQAQDGHNGYLMYINKNVVINALPAKNTKGRYANDARGMSRVRGIRNNSLYVSVGRRCYIEATRDIGKGEEILVNYGKAYWDLIRSIRIKTKRSSAESGKRESPRARLNG